MRQPESARLPLTLAVAAVLVGLEGLLMVVGAVLELLDLHRERVGLGITTALFFLLMGAGLLWCARGLLGQRSWARAPVVVVQLIGLLLSVSFWGGETTLLALVLLVVSVLVLVGVLHPASTHALAAREDEPQGR